MPDIKPHLTINRSLNHNNYYLTFHHGSPILQSPPAKRLHPHLPAPLQLRRLNPHHNRHLIPPDRQLHRLRSELPSVALTHHRKSPLHSHFLHRHHLQLTSHSRQFIWTLAWSISALSILLFRGSYPAGVDVGLDFIGWGLAWGLGIVVLEWAVRMDYPRSCQYRNTSNTFCINSRALMACEVVGGIMALLYG